MHDPFIQVSIPHSRSSPRDYRQRTEASTTGPSTNGARRTSPRRERLLETLHQARRHRRGHVAMHSSKRSSHSHDVIRAMQVLRGTLSKKTITSKSYIQSLDSVSLESLGPSEQMCTICYSDYAEDRAEGDPERPLRIPKCGHVFGDSCLTQWLSSSNICPYCRVELPQKFIYTSTNRHLAALLAKMGPIDSSRASFIERFEWLNQDTLVGLLKADGLEGSNGTGSDDEDDSLSHQNARIYRHLFRSLGDNDHQYIQSDFDVSSEDMDMDTPAAGIPRSAASPRLSDTTSLSPSEGYSPSMAVESDTNQLGVYV
ncbi:hypothetical protein BROUX41_004961 [Berkeleyomyces rouxiae]